MKTLSQYPILSSVLQQADRTIVEAWTVDDVIKLLKSIEASQKKLELEIVKQSNDKYGGARLEKVMAEIKQNQAALLNRLNKLLGITL